MLTYWCWHVLYGHSHLLCKCWLAGVVDMFCMGILILYVSVDLLVLLTCSVWASSFLTEMCVYICLSCQCHAPESLCVCFSCHVWESLCFIPDWSVCVFQLACPKEPVSFNPDGSLDQTKVRLVRPLHHKCMHYSQMKYTTPGTLEYDSINSIRLVRPLHHKCMHYSQMKYTTPSTL